MPRLGPCYWILTPAATSSVFVPTGDLIGWSLRIEVTATNSAGSSKAQSEPTPAIIGNPPVNTVRPRVSVFAVSPTVGEDLTVDEGDWTGAVPAASIPTNGGAVTLPARSRAVRRSPAPSRTATRRPQPIWASPCVSGSRPETRAVPRRRSRITPSRRSRVPRLGPSMTTAPAITGNAELGRTLTATPRLVAWLRPHSLRLGLAALRRDARRLQGRQEREGAQVHRHAGRPRLPDPALGGRRELGRQRAGAFDRDRADHPQPARSRRVGGSSARTGPTTFPAAAVTTSCSAAAEATRSSAEPATIVWTAAAATTISTAARARTGSLPARAATRCWRTTASRPDQLRGRQRPCDRRPGGRRRRGLRGRHSLRQSRRRPRGPGRRRR